MCPLAAIKMSAIKNLAQDNFLTKNHRITSNTSILSSECQLLDYFAIRIILKMVFKGDKHVNAVKEIPKTLRNMSHQYINT